jgi:CRP-like cAMP-binding protein
MTSTSAPQSRFDLPSLRNLTQNHLLAALPPADLERLSPYLELVPMPLGQVLHVSGESMHYAYFPTTAIVARIYVTELGETAATSVVGNEGMLGTALFMDGSTAPNRAVVQSAGYGYRLRARILKQEFECFGPMMHLLLRYTQALITQIAQTSVCNRHHSLEQQLCRWLLLSLDRLESNELNMTQELIAIILGVRRESVTEAAGHLQRAGLIRYLRGHITVLDRLALEKRVCECYAVVKQEFDRLLPYKVPEALQRATAGNISPRAMPSKAMV